MEAPVWTDRHGNFYTGRNGLTPIDREEAERLIGGADKLRAGLDFVGRQPGWMKHRLDGEGE